MNRAFTISAKSLFLIIAVAISVGTIAGYFFGQRGKWEMGVVDTHSRFASAWKLNTATGEMELCSQGKPPTCQSAKKRPLNFLRSGILVPPDDLVSPVELPPDINPDDIPDLSKPSR